MSSTDKTSKLQSKSRESLLKRYFYLWLIIGCCIVLFSILGLHYYADNQNDYQIITSNYKSDSINANFQWICYTDGLDAGKTYALGTDSLLPNEFKVGLPYDMKRICSQLSQQNNFWSLFR